MGSELEGGRGVRGGREGGGERETERRREINTDYPWISPTCSIIKYCERYPKSGRYRSKGAWVLPRKASVGIYSVEMLTESATLCVLNT